MTRFAFRALRPVFDTVPFSVCASGRASSLELWIADSAGFAAATGRADFG
jgi:hydroxyacyl-ACP dehydratase HTD2-like protein with hotdog domain